MFLFDRNLAKVPAFFQSAAFKITSKGAPKLTALEVEAPLKLHVTLKYTSINSCQRQYSFKPSWESCRWNDFAGLTIRNKNLWRIEWLSYTHSSSNIMQQSWKSTKLFIIGKSWQWNYQRRLSRSGWFQEAIDYKLVISGSWMHKF